MTSHEQRRHRMRAKFDEVLGSDVAGDLMESLPPFDWTQIATKDDLQLIHGRLDNMDRRFDNIDGRLDNMDRRFDNIDGRLDNMDRRFDNIDGRFDNMDRRFDNIDGRFGNMDRHFDNIDGRFGTMNDQFGTMNDRFDLLEKRIGITVLKMNIASTFVILGAMSGLLAIVN